MKKLTFLTDRAELFMIPLLLFYWFNTDSFLNPIAIGFIVILLIQFYVKNKYSGVILASLFLWSAIGLLLALRSELNDFETYDTIAMRLEYIMLLFIVCIIAVSAMLFYKYLNKF